IMRYFKTILTSLGLVLMTSATAVAMRLQDPAIKVDVSTSKGSETWYTSPQWLAIIGLALVLIIVIAVMAGRRKSTTTVLRGRAKPSRRILIPSVRRLRFFPEGTSIGGQRWFRC